jgi:hypothetical protein
MLLTLFLAACGGGGGGGSPSSSPGLVAAAPSPPGGSTTTPTQPAPAAGTTGAQFDLAAAGVPRFVSVNYIDLAKITRVSRFRSSAGHDYADSAETCRSMKNYFGFPDASTSLFAPVDGSIVKIDAEQTGGQQVRIRSAAQPAFTFVIFHAVLTEGLKVGSPVTAGQALGKHFGSSTGSDIAVEVDDKSGRRLVSYFETLTDMAFEPYRTRGIASPAQLVITRVERDAAPLTCSGEAFTGTDPLPAWIVF